MKKIVLCMAVLLSFAIVDASAVADSNGDPFANDKSWQMRGQDFSGDFVSLFSSVKTPENLSWGSETSGIKVALEPADPKDIDAKTIGVLIPIEIYVENNSKFWVLLGDYGLYHGVDFFYKDDNGKIIKIAYGKKPVDGAPTNGGTWQPLPANKTLKYLVLVPPEVLKSANRALIVGFEIARSKAPGWDVIYSNEMHFSDVTF